MDIELLRRARSKSPSRKKLDATTTGTSFCAGSFGGRSMRLRGSGSGSSNSYPLKRLSCNVSSHAEEIKEDCNALYPDFFGFGPCDMFGVPREAQLQQIKEVEKAGDKEESVSHPALPTITANAVVDIPDQTFKDQPMIDRVAAEVKKRKDLRIARAPSPPRPLFRPVIVSNGSSSQSYRPEPPLRQSNNQIEAATSNNNRTVSRKRICKECYIFLSHTDVADQRNFRLKRREKKCVACWDLPLQPPSSPSELARIRRLHPADRWATIRAPTPYNPRHISPEEADLRATVAGVLQELATSRTLHVAFEAEDEQWSVPAWIFNLVPRTSSRRFRVMGT
jgi:hypothetical protein